MSQFPTCSHGFGDPNADCPACESESARAVLVEMIEEMIAYLDDIGTTSSKELSNRASKLLQHEA
jgi:hypothetical protein